MKQKRKVSSALPYAKSTCGKPGNSTESKVSTESPRHFDCSSCLFLLASGELEMTPKASCLTATGFKGFAHGILSHVGRHRAGGKWKEAVGKRTEGVENRVVNSDAGKR